MDECREKRKHQNDVLRSEEECVRQSYPGLNLQAMAQAKGPEMGSACGASMPSGVIGVEDRPKNVNLDGAKRREDGSQNNHETIDEGG